MPELNKYEAMKQAVENLVMDIGDEPIVVCVQKNRLRGARTIVVDVCHSGGEPRQTRPVQCDSTLIEKNYE